MWNTNKYRGTTYAEHYGGAVPEHHARMYETERPLQIGRNWPSDSGAHIEAKYHYPGSPAPAFGQSENGEQAKFMWPAVVMTVGFQIGEEEKRDRFVRELQQFIDHFFG